MCSKLFLQDYFYIIDRYQFCYVVIDEHIVDARNLYLVIGD